MPAEAGDRDAALILDMALAARDAIGFVASLDRRPSWPAACTRTQ
jgi:hypothetical protein